MRRVLYYAHQHGSGHLHHAAAAAATARFDLTVVSAHPHAAEVVGHAADAAGMRQPRVLPLPPDLVDGYVQPTDSPLHYTPTGPAIRDRFAALLEAARSAGAEAAVVDVSVEAALFLRLAGYPTAHRRMHGDRTDAAHRIVYAEADHLVAHYRADLEDPAWLDRHGDHTTFLGSPDVTGRLGRTAPAPPADLDGARLAVLTGTGGGGVAVEDLARAAASVPQATWHVHGPVRGVAHGEDPLPENLLLHGWATDVPAVLGAADLVVVSAGHGGTVDALASARPLVLAPEPRPFHEQHRFAAAAHRCAGVPSAAWDDPDADWAGAVEAAAEDPASADRLAAALLTEPAEYADLWEHAIERTIAGSRSP
ncbi:glycosyl transferase [Micrococcus lylae]|uniref:glycosyl transferase n=1 Tax=Micrococcus lylae TaxID=1273 RepID=UPI003EBA395A